MKKLLIIFALSVMTAFCICESAAAEDYQMICSGVNGITPASNVGAATSSLGNNKNWFSSGKVSLTNERFSDAVRVTALPLESAPGYTHLVFSFGNGVLNDGDFLYLSFYYRTRDALSGKTYTNDNSFFLSGICNNSVNMGARNINTTMNGKSDGWVKREYLYRLPENSNKSAFFTLDFTRLTSSYCYEFADIKLIRVPDPGELNGCTDFNTVQKILYPFLENGDTPKEFLKYGYDLKGVFFRHGCIDWVRNSYTFHNFVSEEEVIKEMNEHIPEVGVHKILDGNYAFVEDSINYWNSGSKGKMSIPAKKDENGEFYIPSYIANSIFGVRQSGEYTPGKYIENNTAYSMFTDVRGFVLFSKNLGACIDEGLNDMGYYTSADAVTNAIGEITWDDIHLTDNDYKAYREKRLNIISYPKGYESEYANYIDACMSEAAEYQSRINREAGALSPFTDIAILDRSGTHDPQIRYEMCYSRILTMARAYYIKKSSGIGSINAETMKSDIYYALELMYDKHYTNNNYVYGGTPRMLTFKQYLPSYLADILCFMYDDIDRSVMNKYIDEAQARMADIFSATYTNRLWFVRPYLDLAVLEKDELRINQAMRCMSQIFDINKRGSKLLSDGFYEDGSFLYHDGMAYNLGYGKSLLISIAELSYLTDGTPFSMKKVHGYDRIYDRILNSYLPFIYNGSLSKTVQGRETAFNNTRSLMSAVMIIADMADSETKARISPYIKPYVEDIRSMLLTEQYYDTYTFCQYPTINRVLSGYLSYLDTVTAAEKFSATKVFYNMDRVVHNGNGFTAQLSMSSERTGKYESDNSAYPDSLSEWYINDGMLTLLDGSGQYTFNWWKSVNPYYMPGTTVDSTERSTVQTFSFSSDVWGKPENKWAGGVSDSDICVASMILGNRWVSGLEGRKSYFMLNDKIVCLGAGISGGSGNVYTVVDNRSGLMARAYINGTLKGIASPVNSVNPKWIFDYGTTGYVFHENANVNITREAYKNSVSYNRITIQHGASPEASSYAYTVLPKSNLTKTRSYAENQTTDILYNTDKIQAVFDRESGAFMAAVYEASDICGIEFLTPCNVIIRNNTLYVSDPTMEEDNIKVRIDGKEYSIDVSADRGATYTRYLGDDFSVRVNIESMVFGGGNVQIKGKYFNFSENRSPVLFIALYESDGKLTAIKRITDLCQGGSTEQDIDISISSGKEPAYLKAFVWSDFVHQRPLTPVKEKNYEK